MSRFLTLLLCCLPTAASAQSPPLWGSLQPGKYRVGFQSHWEFDYARTYQMTFADKTTYADGKAPRPILVNIWYPAEPVEEMQPMKHRQYLDITTDDPRLKTLATELVKYNRQVLIKEMLGQAEEKVTPAELKLFDEVMNSPTASLREAPPAAGQFPLVLYHSGYGSSFEDNAVLCEYLASHGFVVVGSAFQEPSGKTFNIDGKDTSGIDMAFLIHTARQLPFVDWKHVGIIGHSGGAHASLVYRARINSPVDAVVSLDTTQDYYSLADTRWDLMTRPVLAHREHFSGPVLVAANPHAHFPLFDALTRSDRYYLTLRDLGHNDFISQGVMEHLVQSRHKPGPESQKKYDAVRHSYDQLCVSIRSFLQAELRGDRGNWDKLQVEYGATPLGTAAPHLDVAKVGTGAASLPPLEQLEAQVLLTPRLVRPCLKKYEIEKTLSLLTALHQKNPESPCFQHSFAYALVFELLEDRNQLGEAQAIHTFYRQHVPEYKDYFYSMGKFFAERGRRDDALINLRKALQLQPDHVEAKARLKELEKK